MATKPDNQRDSSSLSASILVVDDEEGVRKLITNLLCQKGYTVFTASSGESALETWRKMAQNPRLLITDLVMPGMSGKDLAELLRAFQPEIKVLFITGAPLDLMEEAKSAILHSHGLFKPFRVEELISTVEMILLDP
jgi:CheY-like chemotaxis protein